MENIALEEVFKMNQKEEKLRDGEKCITFPSKYIVLIL
jgi:hypothetical protein